MGICLPDSGGMSICLPSVKTPTTAPRRSPSAPFSHVAPLSRVPRHPALSRHPTVPLSHRLAIPHPSGRPTWPRSPCSVMTHRRVIVLRAGSAVPVATHLSIPGRATPVIYPDPAHKGRRLWTLSWPAGRLSVQRPDPSRPTPGSGLEWSRQSGRRQQCTRSGISHGMPPLPPPPGHVQTPTAQPCRKWCGTIGLPARASMVPST